jgi:hypothetical protein
MNQAEIEDGYGQDAYEEDQSFTKPDNNITEVVGILNEYSTNLEQLPLQKHSSNKLPPKVTT